MNHDNNRADNGTKTRGNGAQFTFAATSGRDSAKQSRGRQRARKRADRHGNRNGGTGRQHLTPDNNQEGAAVERDPRHLPLIRSLHQASHLFPLIHPDDDEAWAAAMIKSNDKRLREDRAQDAEIIAKQKYTIFALRDEVRSLRAEVGRLKEENTRAMLKGWGAAQRDVAVVLERMAADLRDDNL